MRLILAAFVLTMLVRPVLAEKNFDDDACRSVEESAYLSFQIAEKRDTMAWELRERNGGYLGVQQATEHDQHVAAAQNWASLAEKYANIYSAFCKE
jgi:hypothetical protein